MQNNQDQNIEEVTTDAVALNTIEESPAEEVPVEEMNSYEDQMRAAFRERAKKDMLYGALWCIGGLVLTLAHIGFIFWGAILFGGIQFFRGLVNYNKA